MLVVKNNLFFKNKHFLNSDYQVSFYVCIELRKGLCLKAPIENLVEVTRRTLDTMRLKFLPCCRVILIRSRA